MTAATRDPRAAVEAVWRLESARIIAGLARLVQDLGLAEELAQDALVAALEDWPETGVPPNPGAWLMLTARRRAIDRFRRDERMVKNLQHLGHDLLTEPDRTSQQFEAVEADDAGDDMLRLIFTACHPILSVESQIALTLRVVGGLTTEEIARAYLSSEATVAQRISRAKRTLSAAEVPFDIPSGADQAQRLTSVLSVVYLVFNEGYSATRGTGWARPELCYEALRLGRMLAAWAATEPEVHGLVALMELHSSRLRARTTADGTPIPLLEQDRTGWDPLLIRRGFQALLYARKLNGNGPYVLQAAIAACHAGARQPSDTDWAQIARLYDQLAVVTPSPVVDLNRAVAVGFASGPEAALHLLDAIDDRYDGHLTHAVRGHFLSRLGRHDEAREHLEIAAAMARNRQEHDVLRSRIADIDTALGGEPKRQPSHDRTPPMDDSS